MIPTALLFRELLLGLLFLRWAVSSGGVVISEIMFDPLFSEATDEFVEIVNLSGDPVDLAGWRIGDGTGDDAIIDAGEGTMLRPGQRAVVLDADYPAASSTYDAMIPEQALVLVIDGPTFGSGGLSNSTAERVTLSDAIGREMSSVQYTIGNAPGHSDEKIDLAGPEHAGNWADSRIVHGTPGYENSVALREIDLAVSRVLVEPEELDRGDEALLRAVVVNRGREGVSDFRVTFFEDADRDSALDAGEEIGVFHPSGSLEAGDSVRASAPWIVPAYGRRTAGAEVFSAEDERLENNVRFLDIDVVFPGGSVLINEIMYDPPAGQPEWVELYVPGEEAVDLSGWSIADEDGAERSVLSEDRVPLAPHDFLLLSGSPSVLDAYSVEDARVLVVHPFPNLNNAGDSFVLYDFSGRSIDSVGYRPGWGGQKVSLERIHPALVSSDSANWGSCAAPEGGTPGYENSLYTPVMPAEAVLSVSPNPFSPDSDGHEDVTVISYRLPMRTCRINLRIFDVQGRLVRTLRGAAYSGAQGAVVWDGKDDSGQRARIGIYIVHIEGLEAATGVLASAKTTVVLAGGL